MSVPFASGGIGTGVIPFLLGSATMRLMILVLVGPREVRTGEFCRDPYRQREFRLWLVSVLRSLYLYQPKF